MTLGAYVMQQFSIAQNLEFFARILIACVCGAIIGLERSMRYKDAGIRTHVIVCCAASLMMIVSKYSFVDLTDPTGLNLNGTRGADPARIAAQVVSGVSFLGAGIIFQKGTSTRGLTTAAGIWATAGIGLAIGSGLYVIGLFTTVIVALLQFFMHKYALSADSSIIGHVHFTVQNMEEFRKPLNDYIETGKMQILASKFELNDDGSSTYDLTLRMGQETTITDLSKFFESQEGMREVSCEIVY